MVENLLFLQDSFVTVMITSWQKQYEKDSVVLKKMIYKQNNKGVTH